MRWISLCEVSQMIFLKMVSHRRRARVAEEPLTERKGFVAWAEDAVRWVAFEGYVHSRADKAWLDRFLFDMK